MPSPELSFYFWFTDSAPLDEENSHYTTLLLIDGLRSLGYRCYSHAAHPLLELKPLTETAAHVVLLEIPAGNYDLSPEAKSFGQQPARARLLHCRSDATSSMIVENGVTALMAHENHFIRFNSPRHPWAFGLSSARIQRLSAATPLAQRRRHLLRNFRPALAQSVRNSLDLALLPLLERHFLIDRTCDVASYPPRLAASLGCLTYCGEYYSEIISNPYYQQFPALVHHAKKRTLTREPVIMRWDSWRFWESLVAGCLTLQLDFEHYGFALPVPPVAWQHYVPLRLDRLREGVEEMMDRESEWQAIATAGRQWALDHYSPVPTAQRFVTLAEALLY